METEAIILSHWHTLLEQSLKEKEACTSETFDLIIICCLWTSRLHFSLDIQLIVAYFSRVWPLRYAELISFFSWEQLKLRGCFIEISSLCTCTGDHFYYSILFKHFVFCGCATQRQLKPLLSLKLWGIFLFKATSMPQLSTDAGMVWSNIVWVLIHFTEFISSSLACKTKIIFSCVSEKSRHVAETWSKCPLLMCDRPTWRKTLSASHMAPLNRAVVPGCEMLSWPGGWFISQVGDNPVWLSHREEMGKEFFHYSPGLSARSITWAINSSAK